MANAFSAGFHRATYFTCPLPVGSSDLTVRYRRFNAACSLGKWPRARTERRNRALRLSIAFVEQMTLRISTVVVEERHEPLPRAYPQAADGRVLVGPPAEYLIARRLGGGLVDGGVHRDEIPPDGAPVAL